MGLSLVARWLISLFDLQYNILLDVLGDLFDVTFLQCVCLDPMNYKFMI